MDVVFPSDSTVYIDQMGHPQNREMSHFWAEMIQYAGKTVTTRTFAGFIKVLVENHVSRMVQGGTIQTQVWDRQRVLEYSLISLQMEFIISVLAGRNPVSQELADRIRHDLTVVTELPLLERYTYDLVP